MKKLKYFLLDTKGQNPKKFILHDQDIVERYKNNLQKHVKTSNINLTNEEIMIEVQKRGAKEITNTLIKQKRQEKGLSQMQAANKCGVSLNTYRYWELGGTTPNEDNIKKLTIVLGLLD